MAKGKLDSLERVAAADRQAWRQWLSKNHATSPGIWLILEKKNGRAERLLLDEAVDEALCYGWIDSLPNKLDETRYLLLMTPRKPGSQWSRVNKEKIERLIKTRRMTAAGLAKIEAAKRDGSWTAIDAVEAGVIPPDLKRALAANSAAQKNFEAFSNSARKGLLQWLQSAKRPQTRANRLAEIVAAAAENRVANQYVRKT